MLFQAMLFLREYNIEVVGFNELGGFFNRGLIGHWNLCTLYYRRKCKSSGLANWERGKSFEYNARGS